MRHRISSSSQVLRLFSRFLCALPLLATMAAGAQAEVKGDAAAGEALVIACGACHGQDGATPIDPTYPVLAGQNEKYLFNQLKMIQSNERQILLMTGQLNGRSEQDLANMAAYYASLPGKGRQSELTDDEVARAANIYRGGLAAKGVAACSACHAPNGKGNAFAGFPAISGQTPAYIVKQLTEYREGIRQTDEGFGQMMRGVAEGLTDGEIRILAGYLEGLN
jgi:cytochrome c553